MIEHVADFDLNLSILLVEWRRVREMYQKLPNTRIRITYSNLEDDTVPCNVAYRDAKIKEYSQSKNGDLGEVFNSWNANNILKPFQNTYTEKVVKDIDRWFRTQGFRSTVVKYAYSKPHTCLPLHTDSYPFRYHIPIKTQHGCMMVINNVLCTMPKMGSMYRMPSTVEHTAINASDEDRIHLIFDVTNL